MANVFELIIERKENYSFVVFEDELAYTPDNEVLYKELYRSFEDAKTRLKSIITEMGLDIHTFRGIVKDNFISVNNLNNEAWYDLRDRLNENDEEAHYKYYYAYITERPLL
jgi:hypothetical protein